jgi:hypothetical protein
MSANDVVLHGTPEERLRLYRETAAACYTQFCRPGATAAERDYALLGVLDNIYAEAELLIELATSEARAPASARAEILQDH